MSTAEKLIQKIFSENQVSYNEAEKLLLGLGYTLKTRGSHHGFRKENFKHIILKRRSQLLPYQIKDLQEVLISHGYKKS
jgi:hypothetical protein